MNARAIIPAGRRLRILRRPPESILPSSPRPARRDCHGRLIAALLDAGGPESDVVDGALTPWCSATFIGARHSLTLVLRGEDAVARADALAGRLPEMEFRIMGHIVAELVVEERQAVSAGEVRLRLGVLTIEAW
jgi:hypothetical protein